MVQIRPYVCKKQNVECFDAVQLLFSDVWIDEQSVRNGTRQENTQGKQASPATLIEPLNDDTALMMETRELSMSLRSSDESTGRHYLSLY